MYTQEEYNQIQQRDMKFARDIWQQIKESPDKDVRYRDNRPIMNIKHMLEESCSEEYYADHVAIYQKDRRGGEYHEITYRELLEMVNALGTSRYQ